MTYVWAAEPAWDGAPRGDWAQRAARQSCGDLASAAAEAADWPSARYAVLVEDPTGGDEFLRWGSSGACGA